MKQNLLQIHNRQDAVEWADRAAIEAEMVAEAAEENVTEQPNVVTRAVNAIFGIFR
ncbi:hypothetical protein ACFLZ7_01865 [Nanoarchaeota archaeon]